MAVHRLIEVSREVYACVCVFKAFGWIRRGEGKVKHTASQMSSLTGKTGSSGLLAARSRGVLGVGRFTPIFFPITIYPARVHSLRMFCNIGRITIIIRDRRTVLHVHLLIRHVSHPVGEKTNAEESE